MRTMALKPLEVLQTYCEMFGAASILNRYAEHVNDPVTHKLEAILASFRHQMRLERSRALTTTHY